MRTFIRTVIAIVAGYLLMWPLDQVRASRPGFEVPLESIGVSEIFGMIFQVCMMGALAPAAPFIIYFAAQFVAPALSPKEMRMIVPGGLSGMPDGIVNPQNTFVENGELPFSPAI